MHFRFCLMAQACGHPGLSSTQACVGARFRFRGRREATPGRSHVPLAQLAGLVPADTVISGHQPPVKVSGVGGSPSPRMRICASLRGFLRLLYLTSSFGLAGLRDKCKLMNLSFVAQACCNRSYKPCLPAPAPVYQKRRTTVTQVDGVTPEHS